MLNIVYSVTDYNIKLNKISKVSLYWIEMKVISIEIMTDFEEMVHNYNAYDIPAQNKYLVLKNNFNFNNL